jgi:hypothetical protein
VKALGALAIGGDIMAELLHAPKTPLSRRAHEGFVGVALVLIGMLLLATTFARAEIFGLLLLPALGIVFLTWGVATRQQGLIIPGGILSGVGFGTLMIETVWRHVSTNQQGGIVLVFLGLGFLIITPLSLLTTRTHLWPLFVGGILLLIGTLLLLGNTGVLIVEWSGKLWPVVLVGIGVWLILRMTQRHEQQ